MAKTIRNATITTGVSTNTNVSEAKLVGKRVVLELNNLNAVGGADIFISIDDEAAANKGRRIQPGQTITWSVDVGYTLPQGRINAFSTAASPLAIYEEIEV